MMLELMYGYPMPKNDVRVCYDGAVFFFYQDPGDDEKVVLAVDSCLSFIPWLRAAAKASDEKPLQARCDIPGGHFRGITKQTAASATWIHEPGSVYPIVQIEQAEDRICFDADEALYLAAILDCSAKPSSSRAKHVLPVRPEDLVVSCPFCGTPQGRLVDCPFGQNEIRCACGFSWSFRHTPDMTEGA